MNTLYYGDNLDILRRYIKDETVDLVYLDPPFNSNANYNVLFAEKDGTSAASQIGAFEDTWSWDQEDEGVYADLLTKGDRVSDCLKAFRTFLGPCDMLAYLVMMAPRLVELHRAMKPSASIYLHCDPTASHYLKLLMDAVFGATNFVNEIVWKRTSAHGDAKQGASHFGRMHDVILFYTKSRQHQSWVQVYTSHDPHYIETHYRNVDDTGRRYMWDNLTGPGGAAKGNPFYKVLGVEGYWRYSRARMDQLLASGLVAIPPSGTKPRLKRYLDEQRGTPVGDLWQDIPPINSQAAERLGYPTQKPEALLERIIRSSSNESDLVLDPFCGCGTTIAAAQKLNRRWIGIDITHLAINLMRYRLADTFGPSLKLQVVGEPVSIPDAKALAGTDQYQFQFWALGLVGARPAEQKKGADRGIDGKIVFQTDNKGNFDTVLISVKAGHTNVAHVRDLRGVLDREKAAIGVLISMQEPTKPMTTEAASAGFYESELWNKKYPKLQLLTIADLLSGKQIDMPPQRQVSATFRKAQKHVAADGEQLGLGLE